MPEIDAIAVIMLETPTLGDRSYLVHDGEVAFAEVPAGEVWVHCAAGYRASIAASFLAADGRPLVAIDDAFGNAQLAGLPVTVPHAV